MNQSQYDQIKKAAYEDELQKIAAREMEDKETGDLLLGHWASQAAADQAVARNPFRAAGNVLGGIGLGALAGGALGAGAAAIPQSLKDSAAEAKKGKIVKFLEKHFTDKAAVRKNKILALAAAGGTLGGLAGSIPGGVAGEYNFYKKRGISMNPVLGPFIGRTRLSPEAQEKYGIRPGEKR